MRINGDAEKLLQELRSEDPAERIYALNALATVSDPSVDDELVRGLFDTDRDCRATAARMLGEREAKGAAPALIHALLDSSSDIAQEAAEALGKIGDSQAVEPLTRVLREYSAPARAAAARALGSLGDRRAVKPLAQSLGDTTESVRAEAAEALGELNAEDAIPDLVGAVGDGTDRVRQAALSALRRLGPRATDALVDELRAPESGRRWRAAWALGECAAPVAAEPLARALEDDAENVRAQAALSLGAVGARHAAGALREAATDPSTAVREAATLSLARLGESPAPDDAGGEETMRMGEDRGPGVGSHNTGEVTLRDRTRSRPARRWSVDLTVLLIALAVLVLVIVLLLGEAIKARGVREVGSTPIPPSRTGETTQPTNAGKEGAATKTAEPGQPSEEPVDGPATSGPGSQDAGSGTTVPPGAGQSPAQCEITNRSWFVDGDALVARGQVVNSGTGVAKNVGVRITVKDSYGEVVARRDGPVKPNRIRPGHSGDFVVSMPLPALTAKPSVEAQVKWD
jgi:HEAT repeat protein